MEKGKLVTPEDFWREADRIADVYDLSLLKRYPTRGPAFTVGQIMDAISFIREAEKRHLVRYWKDEDTPRYAFKIGRGEILFPVYVTVRGTGRKDAKEVFDNIARRAEYLKYRWEKKECETNNGGGRG